MKKTLVDLFEASVSKYPNNTFLLEKTGKKFEPTTYKQVKEQVDKRVKEQVKMKVEGRHYGSA